MVTLGGKDKGLGPGKSFYTPISSAFDLLTPISIGNIFLPWVGYVWYGDFR
jgi:hypothetical protein